MTKRPIRFPMERPVEVRFQGAREDHLVEGRTVNISSSGVLFRADQPISVGHKVDLVVRMSGSVNSPVDLHLRGTVVRSGPGWAAAQVRKYRIVATPPPGIPRDTGSAPGKTGGP